MGKPMTVLMLPAPVGHLTEFWSGYTGTCGPTAATVADGAARGYVISEQTMVDMTHHMIANGWASSNGASTIGGLANELTSRGLTVHNYGYAEPFTVDWHGTLLQYAGVKPIIIELANGQALHDIETGSGENAVNLHYHYICIVGKQDDGYIVADGDNYQVLQRFQIYSYAVLAAAQPCAMIVVEMKRGGTPPVSGIPAGWSDNGSVLRAPNNPYSVTQGFRDFVIANNWRNNDVPLNNAYGWGSNGGTRQDFAFTSIVWEPNNPVKVLENEDQLLSDFRDQTAKATQEIGTLQGQVANLNSQLVAAQNQIAGDKTAIDQLNAQITDLQTKLASAAPPDPRAEEAKTVLDSLTKYVQGN